MNRDPAIDQYPWRVRLRIRFSPYWRGYFDGLRANERARRSFLQLQHHIE